MKNVKRLIINADDFGLSKEVNDAIEYCFSKGLIQCTSLMVNMPFADEAVAISKEHGFSEVIGLHLNLVEGFPLTEDIKKTRFCDESGKYNGSIMKGKNRLIIRKKELKAIEKEVCAQLYKFLAYNLKCHHIDSHRHSHTNYPVLKILLKLLKENKFVDCPIRLSRNIPTIENKGIKGIYKKMINRKIEKFNSKHSSLGISKFGCLEDFEKYEKENGSQNNKIELMIHPVFKNETLADAINCVSIETWLNKRK